MIGAKRLSKLLAATALAAGLWSGTAAAGEPVLVELFTSQGCSSCPPADRYLGELAGHADIVALAFHVDYWDYIGWQDKFARPEHTARQRDYRDALDLRTLYTPQMVIDGRYDAVGSDRSKVEASIEVAGQTAKLPVSLSTAAGKLRISMPAATSAPASPASLWLALYHRRIETPVTRGENAGATLVEYNIVRELKRIDSWTGAAVDLALDVDMSDGNTGCAVFVQLDGNGPVLGVAALPGPNS
jgi:hypothetical protein